MEHDSYKKNMTAARALALFNDVEFAEKYQGAGDEYTDMLLWCKDSLEKQIPNKPNIPWDTQLEQCRCVKEDL